MICSICLSTEISNARNTPNESGYFSMVEGYVKGSSYVVYKCLNCETQFINPKEINEELYDIIYSSKGEFGYQRYAEYVEQIKSQENPLNWLALKEPAYLYVEQYLRGKIKLRILDVGCGEGYLVYALNKAKHNTTGIDISENAIRIAKDNFGNHFTAEDIRDFSIINKFDLIICTETIEHLENPLTFIKECLRLLKSDGSIIITTPNKDYRSPNTIWQTEPPPVHRFWLGHKSFLEIAKHHNLNCEFLPLVMPADMERNNIVAYLSSRGQNKFSSVLDEKGNVISGSSASRNKLRDFLMWYPIRFLSNLAALYVFKIKEPPTLACRLSYKHTNTTQMFK